jgi:hypothetical protein
MAGAVLAAGLTLTAAGAAPAFTGGGAAAPAVQAMVVGRGGAIVTSARSVTAAAGTLHIGGRSCALAAGTPLAVLAALRRGGGPGFAVRDYGHCGSSPSSSAQLFVYSLAGERNSGQNGWEYKVDGYAGSTGAADPSGPRGDGRRIRAGQRVLWFWCQASGAGCQRTLALQVASTSVARGSSFTVTVTAQDNEARSRPVSGAIATLGSDFASSAADGRATLIAPSAPGRYQLTAARTGLVPSFPQTIVVR